nr:transport and Golgi organization protein 2-like [Aedes albopictus]XP_029724241.1 transport and Golgi organization protein 2-like [Aedes albopictus]XP_029724245.1 transport and Golgi organization protein 2-like [Aedes albopictus]
MCILFIYVNNNGEPVPGEYRLVLASNRDEYYTRPAKEAAPWDESPFVIGGRDMEPGREGGTWLAISGQEGVVKIGALLNVTGEIKANVTCGRGPIVANYLVGPLSNEEYSKQLLANDNFGPFNLVSVQVDTSGESSTRGGGVSVLHTSNSPCKIYHCELNGALGFGNSTLEVPLEKVKHGRKQFGDIVDKTLKVESKEKLVDKLMDLLRSEEKHFPDKELSRRVPEFTEKLASIHVRFPESGYGSRTRTVILIDHENHMDFIEETMVTADPDGEWKRTHIERQF